MSRNYLISLLFYAFVGPSIQEDLWYPYQFGSGHGNRRELFINKVDAVDKFKTKENVLEWRSLSLKNRSIALGLTADGVTILQVDKIGESFATSETHTPMNATVVDAAIFKYWKRDTAKSEIIVVVAVDAQHANNSVDLLWFRLHSNNKLIQIWHWPLSKKITHLNIFKLIDEGDTYNILIANVRYENYTTTDWYQFQLGQHSDFWLKQAIHLDSPTNSTAISTHGAKTYLSIPQYDTLRIFSLEEQNTRFMSYLNFSVGYVSFVTSFKVALQSYIAIDGHSAGIYKFGNKHGFLTKQNVDNANLHGIDYWLAIPISTYRDEEILIAERALEFGTHKSHVIQVIIHHGGRFVLHEEMTCDYYGESSSGLNCLVEEDTHANGIKGSTFITVNDTLGVLVPRYQKASGLFVITTEMKELRSPLEEKMRAFEKRKKTIKEKLERLQEKFKQQQQEEEQPKFPEKKVMEPIAEASNDTSQMAAAQSGKVLAQSAPIIDLNMDEITARVSALQETINTMMRDLHNIPSFQPDRPQYDTLILNGLVEVQGPSNIQTVNTAQFNGDTTDKIAKDIFHNQNEEPLSGHKTFASLRADELEFDTINGTPADHLKYKTEPLVFHGNVVLEGQMIVDGDVNSTQVDDMNIEEEIVYIPSEKKFNGTLEFDSLTARQALNTDRANKFPVHHNYQDALAEENPSLEGVLFENIFLPGNLNVTNINGENFNETLKSLCMKNMDTYVPNSTVVEGDITVKEMAFTFFLKSLRFPQDYILSKSNSFSKITGAKNFSNVFVGEMTTDGGINGIILDEIVTLSQPQEIPGKMTFANLDITNGLQLDGEIIGTLPEHKIVSNPSLSESNKIATDVLFKDLEVTGKITIGDTFNGTHLETLLSDVVYKNEESVDINSVKKFPLGLTVLQDLRLASAAINNVDVNKLIQKDTEEVLHINELNGSVTFENILLSGSYNGVDIVKLDQEAVKLSGEQFISSEIVFEEELRVDNLDMKKELNEIPLEEYLYSNGKISLDSLNVDELTVENLIVQKDLTAQEENFNLKDFDERRFSLSKEQIITGDFAVNASRIPNLKTQFINKYDFQDIFGLDAFTRKLMELLKSGKLAIKDLIVYDSVQIEELNGIPMKDILKLCLSTKEGEREIEINFQDVRFGDLHVEKFNDIDFSTFHDNLVFKDDEDVEIMGPKVYFNGFEVNNYIQTSALNNISVYDILRKKERQEIASPLLILGRVSLKGDCQLGEMLNRVPIDNITHAFRALDEHTYRIRGDVVFAKGPIIENLNVKYINGVDMNGYFDHLLHLNEKTPQNIGNITFANKVDISGNLNAEEVDGLDLSSLKDDIVYTTQDGVMQNPVTFASDVVAKDGVEIESALYTGDLLGVNPADWNERGVFINKGKVPQHLNFQSAVIKSDVTTSFLNNINMSTLIPLKSDMKINEKLTFDELSSIKDIKVDNLVNSRKLPVEYENTVRSGQLQHIQDNVVFKGSVLVREMLDIFNLVNERNPGNVVTIDTDQDLSGTYRFMEKAIVNEDVIVSGLVNSINVTKWMQNGVKKVSPETQVVSNSWITGSNLHFEDDVTGTGLLNGLDIHKIAETVEYRRAFKHSVEKDLVDNYQKICSDINSVIATAQKQIFSFKYLEYKHSIELPEDIEHVHAFEHQSKNYLLIKDKGCTSKLFVWMEEYFTLILEHEMGIITQIVTVHDGDDLYLVTRDSDNKKPSKSFAQSACNVEGSNVWKFSEEKLLLTQKLKDQTTLLHESKIPGIFYSMESGAVLEYRLSGDGILYSVQKWSVPTENAAFLEQGFKSGLSIRTGRQLFKLHRQEVPLGIPNNEMAIGNFTTLQNTFIPGRNEEMLILNVGFPRWKKLMAVASHEDTTVMGKLDFIKIYEDPVSGRVFHKVPTFKPSSMVSLEFGENGETLLVFLENKEILQIYEYRGVEGFKFRAQTSVEAEKLIKINLPCGIHRKPRSFIGVVHKNHFGLLEAVMDGDQLELDQLTCNLS